MVHDRPTQMGGWEMRFPPTAWSQILSARDPAHPQRRAVFGAEEAV